MHKFTSLNLTDNKRSYEKEVKKNNKCPFFSSKTVKTFIYSKLKNTTALLIVLKEIHVQTFYQKNKTLETLYLLISNRAITEAEKKFEEQIVKRLFCRATENWKINKGTTKK